MRRSHAVTIAAAGALAVGAELVVLAGVSESSQLVIVMALASIAIGGREVFAGAWEALRARRLSMNLLMSIAVVGAIALGEWPEAAVVVWLFGVAELIEHHSVERAGAAIRGLLDLAPDTATTVGPDGRTDVVAARDIALGTTVRVKPGERIPLDGVVAAGRTTVDQSSITGESEPIGRTVGDPVFAATINQRGSIDVVVTAAAGSGTLDRIAAAVERARLERPASQRLVDRFAAVYTPLVLAAATVVGTVPVILGHGPFADWLYRALVLLVLACPCALVVSVPVAVVSALGGAARRGIVVKGGVHLEQMRRVGIVAFDKTGTLTTGVPSLTDVHVLDDAIDRHDAVRLAASIEARSEHPVAAAVEAACECPRHPVEAFEALPGHGVTAAIDDRRYLLGSHALIEQRHACSREVEDRLAAFEADGKTTMVLARDRAPVAVLAVADDVRPTAAEAVARLRAIGITTVVLSGDNPRTVAAVARRVGIDPGDAHGELMPDDKVRLVTRLQQRAGTADRRHPLVAMVGDGINDAPALARADVGLAMGAGTDVALETADVALLDDDPRKVAELVGISRHTMHVVTQNVVVALAIKAVFLVLTMAGYASLWGAVVADLGATLLVVTNGLRLLRRPGPHFPRRLTHTFVSEDA